MTVRPRVEIHGNDLRWLEPPWPLAFEVATLFPGGSWTLVGGLMVQLHAAIATLPSSRATRDVDAALHLETGAITFSQAAATLTGAGFTLDRGTSFAYRFLRDDEEVDVMCSDRFAAYRQPRFQGRPLYGVPGATRALRNTIDVEFQMAQRKIDLVVPTVQGALVLKGAAFMSDSRDAVRHLEDAVLLLACANEPAQLLQGLSARSRRRIAAVCDSLESRIEPWLTHDQRVSSLAREALAAVRGGSKA